MARRPDTDELKRTLGIFVSRAVQVAGGVKDVVVRGSQVGRIRLDAARAQVEKGRLLWELGREVLARGVELPPDLEELAERVRRIDRDLAGTEQAEERVRAQADALREAGESAARSRPDDFVEEDETPDDDLE